MRSLSVFLFHPTQTIEGQLYVKPHHGKFIESLAEHFDHIYLIAPYWDAEQTRIAIQSGFPKYHYQFKSPRIRIIKGFSKRWNYSLRFFQQIYWFSKSRSSLFFTPSFGSALLGPFFRVISILFQKKYDAYIAINPEAHFKNSFFWIFMQQFFYRGARGLLVTGNELYLRYLSVSKCIRVSPLLDIDLNQFKSEVDLVNRSRFLYVGMIEPRKRIELIIEAVSILKTAGILIELDLIGGAIQTELPYLDKLKELIRDKELEQQIFWHGRVYNWSELAKFYQKARGFILVSAAEGFPKVVYEAMLCGSIPVLSKLGSYQHLWESNLPIYWIDPCNSKTLSQQLLDLFKLNSNDYQERAMKNKLWAHSVLSITPASQYLDLIGSR